MKRISRMLVFSGVALYMTSLWNQGFHITQDPASFILLTLSIAAICYLILPLSKVILFPVNFLTFGLVTTVIYILLIYILDQSTALATISPWTIAEFTYGSFSAGTFTLSYFQNLVVSSFSISGIINVLERVI